MPARGYGLDIPTLRWPLTDERWIVLLEATPNVDASLVNQDTAYGIVRALGGEDGAGLHCPDRVAVQVSVRPIDVGAALSAVRFGWRRAEHELALVGWNVVRAEVLTPEEFRHDLPVRLAAGRPRQGAGRRAPSGTVPGCPFLQPVRRPVGLEPSTPFADLRKRL